MLSLNILNALLLAVSLWSISAHGHTLVTTHDGLDSRAALYRRAQFFTADDYRYRILPRSPAPLQAPPALAKNPAAPVRTASFSSASGKQPTLRRAQTLPISLPGSQRSVTPKSRPGSPGPTAPHSRPGSPGPMTPSSGPGSPGPTTPISRPGVLDPYNHGLAAPPVAGAPGAANKGPGFFQGMKNLAAGGGKWAASHLPSPNKLLKPFDGFIHKPSEARPEAIAMAGSVVSTAVLPNFASGLATGAAGLTLINKGNKIANDANDERIKQRLDRVPTGDVTKNFLSKKWGNWRKTWNGHDEVDLEAGSAGVVRRSLMRRHVYRSIIARQIAEIQMDEAIWG